MASFRPLPRCEDAHYSRQSSLTVAQEASAIPPTAKAIIPQSIQLISSPSAFGRNRVSHYAMFRKLVYSLSLPRLADV
jgi:hypothetical protein